MYETGEKRIYLFDLISELLFSWKKIVFITMIVTVLWSGLSAAGAWRKNRSIIATDGLSKENIEKQHQEILEEARADLTVAEAEEAERLYDQLSSYIEYRKFYQDNFTGYLKAREEYDDDQLIMRVSYRLSSKLEGVENLFTTMALSVDDYRKIMEILPEAKTLTAAYNYLNIGCIAGNTTQITNLGEKEDILSSKYLVVADVVGNNQSICDKIAKVVDKAFQEELKVVKKLDPEAELERIGSQYIGNVEETVAAWKQSTFDYIQRIDSTIYSLKINSIDKLSDAQKTYFKLLSDPEAGLETEIDSGTRMEKLPYFSVKTIVFGLMIGFFFSFALIGLQYAMNGKVKTVNELEDYYNIPVLNTFFIRDKRKGLFPGLTKKLNGTDTFAFKDKSLVVVEDICGLMKKSGTNSLYLVRTTSESGDKAVMETICSTLERQNSEYRVHVGLPLADSAEMRELVNHNNIVLFVHAKKTEQSDIGHLLSICQRHSIEPLGAVAIVEV